MNDAPVDLKEVSFHIISFDISREVLTELDINQQLIRAILGCESS